MQEVIDISDIKKRKYLLVCDSSFEYLPQKVKELKNISLTSFSSFKPNPLYENVVEGIKAFNQNNCDSIIAVGGGSAIDVAKCIKYASINNYFNETINLKEIPFIAIPTTAGTGSESTKFAVIYKDGVKQSISDEYILPNQIVFYNEVLKTLPLYQKKSTMLDALCHAMESYWSINSCKESREYSLESIKLILDNYKDYLEGKDVYTSMFKASNLSGKAINITTTTAGHAMAYKLTSLYGVSHGHAAALVDEKLYPFMLNHIDECVKNESKENLLKLKEIITPEKFISIMNEMNFNKIDFKEEDFKVLDNSVNIQRLKNNPISLTLEEIDYLYHEILRG